jgi:hypothetical protein
MAVSPQEAVDVVIGLLQDSHPEPGESEFIARMVDAGFDSDLANRLLVLVPLAFSRAHFEPVPMTKEYADEYILFDQRSGIEESHGLAGDPYFCAAENAAKSAKDEAFILEIAKRSSEYHAINNVFSNLLEGAVPKRIGTSPPYIIQGEPQPRPWWKFWE